MNELKIFHCDQGSGDWYAARLGIPTASEFQTILQKGRGGAESKGRRTYMLTLLGERLTGLPSWSFSNEHMERGKLMEDEARDLYAMVTDTEPQRIGFMRRGDVGCSPDSLVGEDGLLEIKTKLPHLHLALFLADEVPDEHKAQCQGQLWISGRAWLDFVSYWPGLPLFIKRVTRDEPYIDELEAAVAKFQIETAEALAKVAEYRAAKCPASVQ